MSGRVAEIYERLSQAYGRQNWWPATSPFEMMVGAVLTQNTAWPNVVKALDLLREAGLLDPAALHSASAEELEPFLRPCGFQRVKAARLKNLLRYLFTRHAGDLEALFALPLDELREDLLGINGIGPETADAIVLYGAHQPTFVIDNYTNRVAKRHGLIEFEADYYALKDLFESGLDRDVPLFQEYHALLVKVGATHCRTKPHCENCPLAPLLPDGGPLTNDWQ